MTGEVITGIVSVLFLVVIGFVKHGKSIFS